MHFTHSCPVVNICTYVYCKFFSCTVVSVRNISVYVLAPSPFLFIHTLSWSAWPGKLGNEGQWSQAWTDTADAAGGRWGGRLSGGGQWTRQLGTGLDMRRREREKKKKKEEKY